MASSKVGRRSLLGLATLATTSCAAPRAPLPPNAGQNAGPNAGPGPRGGADRWATFREEFRLSKERIHLASLLLASNPKVVRDAVERFRGMLDDDPVTTLERDFETGEHTNATLDAASRYLGAPRDEIALTDSTTSGITNVMGGLDVMRGDHVLTTKHDHFVTHETLRLLAERTGATVEQVALYDKPSEAKAASMAQAIEKAIRPTTRAVVVTWVHSSTGVKTPVRAIADVLARANAARAVQERIVLCVDGVHGFGVENVTMGDLGADFFVAGCHKWIFGPRGTGIAWGRADLWPRLRMLACPFDGRYVMAREYGGDVPKVTGRTMSPGGFRAFEHRWALREAFDLHLSLGKADVEARIHELSTRCKRGLASMKHVTLHTPLDEAISSGIVCFEVAGLTPDKVVKRLHEGGIVASTTPYRPSYARLTPALVNSPAEIDKALAAIAALAT